MYLFAVLKFHFLIILIIILFIYGLINEFVNSFILIFNCAISF